MRTTRTGSHGARSRRFETLAARRMLAPAACCWSMLVPLEGAARQPRESQETAFGPPKAAASSATPHAPSFVVKQLRVSTRLRFSPSANHKTATDQLAKGCRWFVRIVIS